MLIVFTQQDANFKKKKQPSASQEGLPKIKLVWLTVCLTIIR
jgi:hypothetical protein